LFLVEKISKGAGASTCLRPRSCLREQFARYALQLAVRTDVREQLNIGTEADADALDVRRGIERIGGDDALGEALRANVRLQCANLLEHDALALQEVRLDVFLGSGENSHDVGFGDRGGKLDVFGKLTEVIVAGFDGMVGGVIDALATLRVGATHNLVSDRHSFKIFLMDKWIIVCPVLSHGRTVLSSLTLQRYDEFLTLD